jgi:AbrB family looped-hinge helix DNA binding protein
MKTTIDNAGRLVIPKEIRRLANITPDVALDIRWRDGRIEIEPAPAAVRLQRRGQLLVAVPRGKVAALTPETVEQTRSAILDDRAGSNTRGQ